MEAGPAHVGRGTFCLMRRSSSAAAEPTPTPVPASEERPATHECLRRALASLDLAGLAEAGEQYGDDVERELADIQAGRHPLQRGGRDLDAYARIEAELATIREARRA
jgi:hypothetical protein